MNLVPAETVAAAILHLAGQPRERLQSLYLVSADEAPENNFRDVERTVRQQLGLRPYPVPVVPLPGIALSAMLGMSRRLSVSPRTRFSSERLRAEGFAAPIAFREALVRFAADAALSASRKGPA
jgi:hypothetical protein